MRCFFVTIFFYLSRAKPRTLKSIRTSKGDYWNKQDSHKLRSFSKWGLLLQQRICSQGERILTFKRGPRLMVRKTISPCMFGDFHWMWTILKRKCVTAKWNLRLCFCFVFFMLSCLFIAALWSPAGKGLTSWLSCMWFFLVFCDFPMWCPGSDVVLVCIDSWSLPCYLLL